MHSNSIVASCNLRKIVKKNRESEWKNVHVYMYLSISIQFFRFRESCMIYRKIVIRE